MHKYVFVFILIDQITKLIFWSRDFFIGPLHIHSMKNYGLGFSINFGLIPNVLIIVAALIFFIYYYWHSRKNLNWFYELFFILIFAGAISNLADRIYLGYVRDFFDLGLNFTFNLADLFLAIGLLGILLSQSKIDKIADY
jgi:signal peptidase II